MSMMIIEGEIVAWGKKELWVLEIGEVSKKMLIPNSSSYMIAIITL